MADRKIRRMKRAELLELLVLQEKEIAELKEQLHMVKEQLKKREIAIARSGSIAEAALRINGVFEAAQAAADQYLENLGALEKDDEQ